MFEFFEYIAWIGQVLNILLGVLIGIFLTIVLTPAAFRLQRGLALRRNWRADRPGRIEEGLYPEWQKYDPDIPGIAKRCVCHHRVINPGERVLTWPETGPMHLLHVAVYCESVKERLWDTSE